MISKKEQKESAVSPVIGVMLMLVITIVVAGVVSVIAGGLTEGVNESPTAVIKLDDYSLVWRDASNGYDITDVVFKHMSGDPLHLDDVNLVLVGDESGILSTYDDLLQYDVNEDGLWESGETLHIHVPSSGWSSFGVLQQSFFTPFKMTFHVVTKSGEILAEETVTII
ncbi:MAG: type IV pilin [Methanocorpusculum sp.]|nr:type IV pilin [Methanocorpusculum sp.]